MNEQSNRPKVSIVTCFLNAEPYLQTAIDSVLTQSYEQFELLLIDDGSIDGSSEIARENAVRDDRVRVLQHDQHANCGKVISRNLGIERAQGKYVVFLDADDLLLPEKLAHQVQLLQDHPEVDTVLGRTLYWFSDSDPAVHDYLSPMISKPGTVFKAPQLMVRLLRNRGLVPCLCSPMISLDRVRQLGGFDVSIQHLFEDQVLLAKVFLTGATLIDDFCGEKYRQHPGSSSAAAMRSGEYHPWRLNESERRYYLWLADYLVDRGIDDPELARALERARRKYRFPRLYGGLRALAHAFDRLRAPFRRAGWRTAPGSRQ